MITFDINGAIVEFDEKMDNYNSIRKLFSYYAKEVSTSYETTCIDNISSKRELSDSGLEISDELINDVIRKAIECIVSYGVITVDFDTFKEIYCNKYLNFQRLFINLRKELLLPYKSKRNNKTHELRPTIKLLSEYIYTDCFNIHLAVIDALMDNGVENISTFLDSENIKRSNALFNNYKDGFITKPDECRVVKQIISLNPYREDVYEFLIKEDGDFSNEVEKLTEYLGYDIKQYKSTLMDIYIKELMEDKFDDIEIAKEKLIKYSKYIGCKDSELYITRIDSIYSFESA